ncbi:MAG: putative transcriptional regulator, arsr family [Paenibacillaceae bacterium]|jgi:DNA-binding transcriptional ArsR family regulator|nr:putative transcriptional regulator, arsr family [Paenibacillaceae bacterium]
MNRGGQVENAEYKPAGDEADHTADKCESECVHADAVESAKKEAAGSDQIEDLANLFKALSDQTRLRIIHSLLNRELCVCDICDVLDMQQSAVSHQLRVLRNMRIVRRRKEGKMMFYSLDDQHVEGLFLQGLHHISHK